jgi:hypothetical protein
MHIGCLLPARRLLWMSPADRAGSLGQDAREPEMADTAGTERHQTTQDDGEKIDDVAGAVRDLIQYRLQEPRWTW